MIPVAFGGFRVMNYTQDDPSFCRSCHTMQKAWDKWATSVHREVNCHSCHEQNPIESAELVLQYVTARPNDVKKHAGISDEACLKCHANGNGNGTGNVTGSSDGNGDGEKASPQIIHTAGHKVHVEDEKIACTKCHSVSIHRFEAPAKICMACHNEEVTLTKMARRYCLDCHNYLRDNSTLRPTRETCLDCHQAQVQSEVHWPANAPMQFQCSQCHKPHTAEKPQEACKSCHTGIPQQGLHKVKTHSQATCTACHKPHEWKVTDRKTCESCHGDRSKHSPNIACATCHTGKQPA